MNYKKELENILNGIDKNAKKSLLLHSCCAPCSSYVLEYLCEYFDITVLYYNPNINPEAEYLRRLEEQKMLLSHYNVMFIEAPYEKAAFNAATSGLFDVPEGGERCKKCYELRLKYTASLAHDYDFFTTTLSISPHKSSIVLNEIGERVAKESGTSYLPSDFKKNGGYQRSLVLSKQYGLYRQDYCGCKPRAKEPLANLAKQLYKT